MHQSLFLFFFCRTISGVWASFFTLFGIKYELRNGEFLKSNKPCIIVANHQSSLDVFGKRCLELCSHLYWYIYPEELGDTKHFRSHSVQDEDCMKFA